MVGTWREREREREEPKDALRVWEERKVWTVSRRGKEAVAGGGDLREDGPEQTPGGELAKIEKVLNCVWFTGSTCVFVCMFMH